MGILRFEDIISWQKARQLTLDIYKTFEGQKDFEFKNQIQRASVSIMNNIAEGFERKTEKEFTYFLYMAKGSTAEVRSMLYLAKDLNKISDEDFKRLYQLTMQISQLISGFIRHINEKENTKKTK